MLSLMEASKSEFSSTIIRLLRELVIKKPASVA